LQQNPRVFARTFWNILLATTIALMGLFAGLYGLIGLSDQTVYFVLIPIGTASLLLLRLRDKKWRDSPPGWSTALFLFVVFGAADLMLIVFAGFVIGPGVYFVIFAHVLAFLVGLIYYWLRLPRGPEPMMRH
jgi:hypothetical protein